MTKRYQWTSAAPEPQCGERPKRVKTRAEAHRATMVTKGPNQGLIAPTRQRQTPREGTSLASAVGNQATTPTTVAPKLNKGSTLWISTPNTKRNTKATKSPSTV